MDNEINGIIKNSIEGPRWAKFPSFLRDLCWEMDLELELETEKGWIRETVRFKITGSETKLRQAMKTINESLTAYNAT